MTGENLPVPHDGPDFELTDYDYMIAAILDMIVDGVPLESVEQLCVDAENAREFFAGMQALIHLGDIVADHYAQETYDGEETDDEEGYGTKGDDFDPPEDWFDEGGPFGPRNV